jgi:hypothetical protein
MARTLQNAGVQDVSFVTRSTSSPIGTPLAVTVDHQSLEERRQVVGHRVLAVEEE